jgi:hypothetical protein
MLISCMAYVSVKHATGVEEIAKKKQGIYLLQKKRIYKQN